jgi:membrane-associated phospholipid phosphatase
MPNKIPSTSAADRVTVWLRLEDAAAAAFFLLALLVRTAFRELRHDTVSPQDVLVIIPAVTLLLAKELVNYFLAGGAASSGATRTATRPDQNSAIGPAADFRQFVRPYWEIVRDWFPFFVILMMYYSLWGDATHLLVTHDRDAALIAWDQRLFGFQASLALQRFISPPLTAWMEFAYFFHVWNIPLVACFIYLRRPREQFREMMSGVIIVTLFGLIGYLLVPAVGPMYTLRAHYTVALNQPLAIFNREMDFMDFARIRRDVFPSLHVGMSFVVWLYAYRNSRTLFWMLAPLMLSLWISAVYLRYHYLVDCLAGFILAPLAFLLSNWLFKRWGEIPVSLPVASRNRSTGSPGVPPVAASNRRREKIGEEGQ